jgi:hypothetical protein
VIVRSSVPIAPGGLGAIGAVGPLIRLHCGEPCGSRRIVLARAMQFPRKTPRRWRSARPQVNVAVDGIGQRARLRPFGGHERPTGIAERELEGGEPTIDGVSIVREAIAELEDHTALLALHMLDRLAIAQQRRARPALRLGDAREQVV